MAIKTDTGSPAMQGDRIIRATELGHVIGVGKTATYEIIKQPDFPRAIKITQTVRGWFLSEVMAWLMARRSK